MHSDPTQEAGDEAVRWFVLLRDEDATAQDRDDFARWRRADLAHEQAWRDVVRLWGALDSLPLSPVTAAVPKSYRGVGKRFAAAAAFVCAVGLGWQALPADLTADYRTSVGERRTIALSDGSEVELGTASAMDVEFAPAERRVVLRSGEAFFTVAKDGARPFSVITPHGEIRVLGTAFDVKIGTEVTVAVTHNSVEVRPDTSEPVRLAEGQSVQYGAGSVSAVGVADLDATQAWRRGKLVFRDVPLSRVLAELSRYRYGHVILLDGALGQRPVTAVFDADRADAAIETIARTLSLKVYSATPYLIGLAPG